MNSRANLSKIEQNYPENYRKGFEDLSTHMFMRMLGISAPLRRTNQKGIEADPVDVKIKDSEEFKSGCYTFQSKYYEPRTEISDKKDEFLKSIAVAKERGATDHIFFVNKDLKENSRTGEIPSYEAEINNAAIEAGITLHWYTRDRIETELDLDEYRYIRDLFLCDKYKRDIAGFYQDVCYRMIRESENALYGHMSLLDGYIEPRIIDRNYIGNWWPNANREETEHNVRVREFLETWVGGNEFITIICGEPGHGKTSLCRKAMYDFYKKQWLVNKVENVFCFSLNPAGTDAVKDGRLDSFYSLFSWGQDEERRESQKRIDIDYWRRSLVFLDGFDELLEFIPGYSMESLLKKIHTIIDRFDKTQKPHVIITTRKMAISPRKRSFDITGYQRVHVKELQLISEKEQYEWIEQYAAYVNGYQENEDVLRGRVDGGRISNPEEYLKKYRKMYCDLDPNDELRSILGIPVIFRMIVAAEFIPQKGNHPAVIYDKLFSLTWQRHNVATDLKHDEVYMKRKIGKLALRIYADNNDSTEVKEKPGEEESSWLYAFYTKYQLDEKQGYISNSTRVSFCHRTFYEYFLAYEILTWFKFCQEDGKIYFNNDDTVVFKDMLALLAKKRLSEGVLLSIKMLYENNLAEERDEKGGYVTSFVAAYGILNETDGIIDLPTYEMSECIPDMNCGIKKQLNEIAALIKRDKTLSPLKRGNNVFWNVVSIGSICRCPFYLCVNNDLALKRYDLSGCHMNGAVLVGADLSEAKLREAHLNKANLRKANLHGANLFNVDLSEANLEETSLQRAFIFGSNMRNAHLKKANLRWADISMVNLEGANLENADLCWAYIMGAKINGSKIIGVVVNSSEIESWKSLGADTSKMRIMR